MSTISQAELYRLIAESNGRGERVVVATVAHTRGSTPQRRGAKMLFFESGGTAGTVGGGCIEAEVWAEARARGERVVVATVAHTRGSTPQRRGAKMLFFEGGQTAGTVGGGCIEAEVWAEAREALRTGRSALHRFSLTADEASEEGMVCGGTMEIFIDVWEGQSRDG